MLLAFDAPGLERRGLMRAFGLESKDNGRMR